MTVSIRCRSSVHSTLALLTLCGVAAIGGRCEAGEPNVQLLWPNGAPGAKGDTPADKPTLTIYLPEPSQANGTAVVICPGGGYGHVAIDHEGHAIAQWFNSLGVAGFIVDYRHRKKGYGHPAPKQDAQRAVRTVRARAAVWKVDPGRIGIMGFSAGGTVVASVAYNYTPDTRPNFVAPIYLAYDWAIKGEVPADAPPMFILAATDDQIGLAPHSVRLYNDWTAAKKSAELHLLSKGGHGFGMRKQNLPSDRWIERFADWLDAQGLLK